MTIIYGVDTDKPTTILMVRDAIIECFTQAHKQVLEKDLCDFKGCMKPEDFENLKKINMTQLIQSFFKEMGAKFEEPAKQDLINLCDKLAEYAKKYRSPEIIKKHYGEIMILMEKLT